MAILDELSAAAAQYVEGVWKHGAQTLTIDSDQRRVLTTREVLHEESEMLRIVEAGRGKHDRIGGGCGWDSEALNDEQLAAVLKNEGFNASETVQGLMHNPILEDIAKGKILLVDEAGFLSAKQMRWIVEFASKNGCRLILSGDTRQHHSVERGDSVRVLEALGALKPAVLTRIFRQKVAALREAIGDLAKGKTLEGFDKLEQYGAIHEIEDQATRLGAICQKYLEVTKNKKTSLIVAPYAR